MLFFGFGERKVEDFYYFCQRYSTYNNMADDYNIVQENEKRYPRFANFGEMMFLSYANLQMLFVVIKEGKAKYDCKKFQFQNG